MSLTPEPKPAACIGFSTPSGDETLYKGDSFTISWSGGLIPDVPAESDVCTFRLQLNIPRLQRVETIVDHHNFTWDTPSWYPMNLGCSYAQTQMSYDWAIPRDLELTGSDLTQCSITFTNLTDDSTRTFSSNVFNIRAATASAAATSSATTGPADTSTTSPAPSPGAPLSAGAKAGIGVGAAVVALCCALGAYFFMRRRRRKRTAVVPERPVEERGSGYAKAEMDAGEARQRTELDAAPPSGQHAAQELDGRQKVPERHPAELMG